jgi:hypothetical protein
MKDLPERFLHVGLLLANVEFMFNVRERLQEQLADVGKDGGVARRNAVGGQKDEKFSQDVIHGSGSAEVVDRAEKIHSESEGTVVLLALFTGMVGAE